MHRLAVSFRNAVVILLGGLLFWTGCGSGEESGESADRFGDLNRSTIPREARSYLVNANDALKQGAYHTALALADSAEQVKSDLSDADFIRGRVYTELKQFEKAQQAYERVIERTPDFDGIRMNMGNNAFRQGQFREAIRWYREEQEYYRSARLWLHLGRAYDQLEKPDSAVYAYEQAISYDTTATSTNVRAEGHIRLAQVLEDRGRVQEGLQHARQAVNLASHEATYRYVLGSLLFQAGNVEAAERQLKRVVEADPGHQSAQYRLGQALIRQGREEAAQPYMNAADSLQQMNDKISQLRTMAEQNPDQPKRWITLGQALRKAGRYQEAMEAYRIVLSMKPESRSLQMMVANLALRAGQSNEAIQRYQTVLSQDSTFTDAWINLGVVYATSGRTDQARAAWERALELEPENQRVQSYLTRLAQNQ